MVSDRFRLRYRLKPELLQLMGKLAVVRAAKKRGWLKTALISWALAAFLTILSIAFFELVLNQKAFLPSFVVGFIIAFVYIKLSAKLCQRQLLDNLSPRHLAVGEFALVAYDAGGIQITGKHITSSYEWAAVLEVSETKEMVVLWVDRDRGIVIPISAFADEEEQHSFVDYVKERIEANRQVEAPAEA